MRCTLTTGGGGPGTSPSPVLTSSGTASPLSDRERRSPPLRLAAFAADDDVERSTDLILVLLVRRRVALSALRTEAKAASSAGSTSCRPGRQAVKSSA